MAHPFASQVSASKSRRLRALGAHAGKPHGASNMLHAKSLPKKNAGTQREFTISGKAAPKRADRRAMGGSVGKSVGKYADGGGVGGGKKHHKPAHTTNIIISHAGGRGGGGGGGGRPGIAPPAAPPVGVPVPHPMPVPVPARPPLPVGAAPMAPGAAGPLPGGGPAPPVPMRPPLPVRPPMPAAAPAAPPIRPPGMASGGVVRKAAHGGFLKEGMTKGKTKGGYPGYPHAPTTAKGAANSPGVDQIPPEDKLRRGGKVKKRQFGGGLGNSPFGASGASTAGQPGGTAGLFGGVAPGRQAAQPIQGPPTVSGRPMIPAQPLTVPMSTMLTSRLTRPAPGTTVGYSKKGGAVHGDEAEDRKLIKSMLKKEEKKEQKEEKAEKRAEGGFVPKNQDSSDRHLAGHKYRQQGVGYRNMGGTAGTKEGTESPGPSMPGSASGGKGRLAKAGMARKVPAETEV